MVKGNEMDRDIFILPFLVLVRVNAYSVFVGHVRTTLDGAQYVTYES